MLLGACGTEYLSALLFAGSMYKLRDFSISLKVFRHQHRNPTTPTNGASGNRDVVSSVMRDVVNLWKGGGGTRTARAWREKAQNQYRLHLSIK